MIEDPEDPDYYFDWERHIGIKERYQQKLSKEKMQELKKRPDIHKELMREIAKIRDEVLKPGEMSYQAIKGAERKVMALQRKPEFTKTQRYNNLRKI